MKIDGKPNKNLQNCAGITSGSRSSSSNSVAALMSLLPLLLYCHRGLDFEYFFFYVFRKQITTAAGNKTRKIQTVVMSLCKWCGKHERMKESRKNSRNGKSFSLHEFTSIICDKTN